MNAVAAAELDGRPVVISGSDDQTVRVWDLATGAPVGDPFTGHRGWVLAVAAAELDGRPVVISGSRDGTVRVWDLATGDPGRRPVHRPRRGGARGGGGGAGRPPGGHLRQQRRDGAGVGPGHRRPRSATRSPATTAPVHAVAAAELDGRPVVISGSSDGTVRVWDLATGTPVGGPFTGHDGTGERGGGGRAGRPPGGHLRQRRRDGAGVGPGHRRPRSATRSPATAAPVNAVAAAELDGRPVVISGSGDGTVRVWDLATGTPVGDPFTGHRDWVRSVAAAELDGRPVVISGSDDQTVRVWDLATGTPVGGPFTGHDGEVSRWRRPSWTAARWSSPAAATGRCGCGTWPPGPRSAARSPATAGRCSRWRRPSWTAARWSSPAATTGRCGCGTWPPATPVGGPFTGHGGEVLAVAAAELDGRPVVISGSDDRTVRVWDLATGAPVGDPFTGHGG